MDTNIRPSNNVGWWCNIPAIHRSVDTHLTSGGNYSTDMESD